MEAFEPARKLIEAVNLAGGRFLGKTLNRGTDVVVIVW